jgi:hypothetical protein
MIAPCGSQICGKIVKVLKPVGEIAIRTFAGTLLNEDRAAAKITTCHCNIRFGLATLIRSERHSRPRLSSGWR